MRAKTLISVRTCKDVYIAVPRITPRIILFCCTGFVKLAIRVCWLFGYSYYSVAGCCFILHFHYIHASWIISSILEYIHISNGRKCSNCGKLVLCTDYKFIESSST